jgi:DNA-binding SARP family transcriptional activator
MSILRIQLFGQLRVTHDDRNSEVRIPPALQPLLAYLLLEKHRAHSREKLTNLFWGDCDQEKARSCLRTALWRLRRLFESQGVSWKSYLATAPTGEISFKQESDYWLDVAVFERQANQILAQPIQAVEADGIQQLECALELYTGELLEDFYDEWLLWERERLERLYLNSLAYLLRYYGCHGAYEKGLECGHEILFHDSLREEVHREMMRLYMKSGQRALAVQQYETCRDILASELNIEPMKKTQALYAWIVSEAGQLRASPGDLQESTSVQQALEQICLGMRSLRDAQDQFQQAIDLIGRTRPGV